MEGPSYSRHSGLSAGQIFGIVMGVLFGVALIGFVGFYVFRSRKAGSRSEGMVDYESMMLDDADEI